MTINIEAFSIHKIDIDNNTFSEIPVGTIPSDLNEYLGKLLDDIPKRDSKRKFTFQSETTEFHTILKSYGSLYLDDEIKEKFNSNLPQRLLKCEIDSDQSMRRLNPEGHLNRGSYLQFFYTEDDIAFFLGVKVEHTAFIDEDELTKKIGMPEIKKTYKACIVEYDENLVPDKFGILVFDTNSTISKYWWDDFLELKEQTSDEKNTRIAIDSVIGKLNFYRKKHPQDHTLLRNATIARFRQGGSLKFDDFVKDTFENYVPEDESFKDKLPKLIAALKKLPETKQFDTHFDLVPSEIPKKYKRRKVKLSDEIDISYDESMNSLEEKIWAKKLPNGDKVVVINSPEGYQIFKRRNID